MDAVTAAILDAWALHGERILSSPLELEKRLARRRLKTLRRPLRGWCLTVRASDLRINPWTEIITSYHAADPEHPEDYDDHEVTLTSETLRRLCRPFRIPPGADWKEIAALLGCNKNNLVSARKRKLFHTVHYKNLGGQFGKPIPTLQYEHHLDPTAGRVAVRADPVWAGSYIQLADMVPDGIEQTILRVPNTIVTYGKPAHRGWFWICPACRQRVKLLYYPIKPFNLPEFLGMERLRDEVDQVQPPPASFACVRCHGVRYYCRIDPNSWGELIHHLSGGLLYGCEVTKPEWLTKDRKRAYHPIINRAPSKRREEVLERLLRGWKDRQIAKDLGISFHRTRNHVKEVLKQHRAKNRKELIRQLSADVWRGGAEVAENAKKEVSTNLTNLHE